MSYTGPRNPVAAHANEAQPQLDLPSPPQSSSDASEAAAPKPLRNPARSGARRKVAASTAPTAPASAQSTDDSDAGTDSVEQIYAMLTAENAAGNAARRANRGELARSSVTFADARESYRALLTRNIDLAIDITEAAENEIEDKPRAQLAKDSHALNLSIGRLTLMLGRLDHMDPKKPDDDHSA